MSAKEQKQKLRRRKNSRSAMVWRQFHKSKTAILGLCILALFVIFAIGADWIENYDLRALATNEAARFQTPSLKHLFTDQSHIFGTDEYGRDVFARIIHGSRVSLSIGIISTSCAAAVGGLLGAVAAFYGKKWDFIIMRIMDVISSVPSILLAMAVVAALGANLTNLLIALTFSSIATYARLVRSSVLTLTGQEFIEAARACGSSDFRIITRHIVPNSLSPIICQMAFSSSRMILTAASMSYLGLGIQPPNPEWGAMLASAKTYMWTYPHLITIPGICIVLAALSITLIGDGLRDALDPKLKD
ncbi:MAG: ABC transporter permease [Clostridiaceae bacterium]|nr:ABC transporter permease [Clostridiaceae bacterium]